MVQLGEHFGSKDASSYSQSLRNRQWFIKAKEHDRRREIAEDKLEANLFTDAVAASIATEIQIEKFEFELTQYEARLDASDEKLTAMDEAIVLAIVEQLELRDFLLAEREMMLADAFVLPDGRRIFKSLDGETVKDEHGEIISAEEFNPDQIPDGAPSLEGFEKNRDDLAKNKKELGALHDAQEEVRKHLEDNGQSRGIINDARERAQSGDMTVGEIEKENANIEARVSDDFDISDLPPSAQRHMNGVNPNAAPNLMTEFAVPTDQTFLEKFEVKSEINTLNIK